MNRCTHRFTPSAHFANMDSCEKCHRVRKSRKTVVQ